MIEWQHFDWIYLQGGDKLTTLDEIKSLINSCEKTTTVWKEVEEFKNSKKSAHDSKKKPNWYRNMEKTQVNNNIWNPCRKHDSKYDWKNYPDNSNCKKNAGSNEKGKPYSCNASKDKEKNKDQKMKKKKSDGENFLMERSWCKSDSRVEFDCNQMLLDDEQQEESVTDNAETFMLEQIKGQDTWVQDAHPEVIVVIPTDPDGLESIGICCLLNICYAGIIINTSLAKSLLELGKYISQLVNPSPGTPAMASSQQQAKSSFQKS